MRRILLRRFAQIIPLILGVIVLNFALIQMSPGSFLDVMTAEQQVSDPAMIERMRVLYGMDKPVVVQLLKYIWSVMTLDFGYSYRQNETVLAVIGQALPATVILMLASIAIALLIGVLAGVIAAVKVNTIWDNLISVGAVFFFAAPTFWLGIMLMIVFSVRLGWLPVGGMRDIGVDHGVFGDALDVMRHLALPALSLGLFYAAMYTRVMRASMLEVFRHDFVRTARAKGLSGAQVVLRHVFRNALLPVVTLLGLQLGTVLGGSVVIETVFSWPGIGSLMLDSVMSRNYPVVLGVLVLSSLIVAVANALVDIAYFRLDPRIRAR
ncbi:ABC transporter permease [Azorhizobium oxalatiphilum]|uniref:ABC transporter permease n=1 Tax=Azorhizobium oxalatiphilum TaxID=980631 RepID=A0A917BZJ2_9HYPH|nr:ABC transporter permease [Azorhizobium oxalatiphilum]GGF61621.1 ABC transporter permease [Azorhizobium oxalatiphilum]